MREDEGAKGHDRGRQEPPPDLLERAVSWISVALVVALAAFFLWEGLQQTAPVAITAQVEAPWQADGIYYLPLEVRNTGGQSVQNLRLQVQLTRGAQQVETSETMLSWLPAYSSRRVVTAFEHDPRTFDVHVVPQGYEQP